MRSENNVILFPKWKNKLEKESLEALKNKQFEIALRKLNKLLSYQVNDHEIITGKLICLMELNRYNEAQDLCEELILEDSDHYYQYIHIYLTLLFQTSQYDLLMEQAEMELANSSLPESYRNQFEQLYDMSEKMKMDVNVEKSEKILDDLFQIVNENDHVSQWQLVENLRKMKINPTNRVAELLVAPHIHPVVKTAIFKWMKDLRMSQEVKIHKFSSELFLIPDETPEIRNQEIYQEIEKVIIDVEQQNPTLFYMIEQILYRYAYVLYPLLPPNGEAREIGEALVEIGEKYLNIHNQHERFTEISGERVNHYIEIIKMCESLYMSVVED